MREQPAQSAAVSMGRARAETAGAITLRISHKQVGAVALTARDVRIGQIGSGSRHNLPRDAGMFSIMTHSSYPAWRDSTILEPEIVREFARIPAIPNHASDAATIRRNAVLIAQLLSKVVLVLTLIFAGTELAAAQATIPVQFVSREDGGRIAYYTLLQAKTVPVFVLSGGPGTNSRYMRARGALDRLAQTRSMILFDQRGTSRSSDANGNESIDQYVEDIEAIRKAVGAPQVDLLGHSFGGYLAIAYTSKYPQHVRGLVFVDSAAPKLGDVTQLMDQVFPDRIGEWRAKRATLGKHVKGTDVVVFQSMEFVDEVALREFLDFVKDHTSNMDVNNALRKDMASRDYWDDVKRFKQPALVVHGRFDVIVIEAAGHLPHIERPDAFLAAVQPFLEALDR